MEGSRAMKNLELNNEEQEILSQVLQTSLATLELELLHTDHKEFKELLKHRRQVLRGLAARVPQPARVA
jgi:hypothetical protein